MRVFGRLIYFLIVLLAVAAHAIDARSGQPVILERPIILGDIDRAVDPRARRSLTMGDGSGLSRSPGRVPFNSGTGNADGREAREVCEVILRAMGDTPTISPMNGCWAFQ